MLILLPVSCSSVYILLMRIALPLPTPSVPPPLPFASPSPSLTQLLCIITEKEEDVAAFKDYQEPTTSPPPQEKVCTKHTSDELACFMSCSVSSPFVVTLAGHTRRMCTLPRPPLNLLLPLMCHQCPSHPPLVCLSVRTFTPYWPQCYRHTRHRVQWSAWWSPNKMSPTITSLWTSWTTS